MAAEALTELLSLAGRRAVITGAASGIGRAMAFRFAEAGAQVELVDLNERALQAVAKEVAQRGGQTRTQAADLADDAAIRELWKRIGGSTVDVLVNNAGIFPMKKLLEVEPAFLRHVEDVNANSAYWMCQQFIRARGKAGGVIINVSSVEAVLPSQPHLTHYSMAKSAVMALTRSLAKEYGGLGYRVNCIIPGGIDTPATRAIARQIFPLHLDLLRSGLQFRNRLPVGRMGQPDEVARVALFLASGLASYVQGALIPVDGGFLSA